MPAVLKTEDGRPRCRAKSKKTGQRCPNAALEGLLVCYQHGGATAKAKEKSNRARVLSAMERFVGIEPADSALANPTAAFEWEFRRTVARIRWYDEQLALLRDEKDLIWGVSKIEEVGATEFEGVNTTYEARVNLLVQMQTEERKHLLAMEKVWLGAKLDTAKLEIQRNYVTALEQALSGVLAKLGHDTDSPQVREIVMGELLALASPERAK